VTLLLLLHGFTGNPITMRSLTDAFVAAGFTVSVPRLPGHGTTVRMSWPTEASPPDDPDLLATNMAT